MAGALAVAFGAGAAETLFPNGDFEKGMSDWKIPQDGTWQVAEGAGIGGSRALVVEIPEGQPFRYVLSDDFPIEAGTVYSFEVRVKNENFVCKYGKYGPSFSWKDASGRELGSCGGIAQADNEVGNDGWYRFSGTTAPLPREAVTGRFVIWAPANNCSGRMRFDDFRIRQTDSRPGVMAVHTSVYRDTAASGKVRIAAEYFANPVRFDDAKLKGAFELKGPLRTVRIAPSRMGGGTAEAEFDAGALPVGDYGLSFGLDDGDGKRLGSKSIPFHRVAKLPKRKVAFDAAGRTLVDGKPFFPLGMYWMDVTEKNLQTYTNGPFNCIMSYRASTREQLDLAWKYGIRVIYTSQGFYEAYASKPEKEAEYVALRMAYRDHPALLAWYVCDELKTSLIPQLIKRNLAFRAADPDHPTWQVLNYPDKSREFMDGADVLGCDPYPIGGRHDGTSAPISIASGSPAKLSAGAYGMRPMWNVPQMFNWAWYRKEHANSPGVRMPTRAEMANMAWQSVAAGSNGLIFYSFFDVMTKEPDEAKREAYWQDMLSVVREVKRWETVLLSDPSDLTIAGVPADKLVVRVWKCQGEDVALAVNRTENETVKADLAFSNGKKVTVDLKPLGYRFLRLGR